MRRGNVDRPTGPTIPGMADLPPPPEDEDETGTLDDEIVVGPDGRRYRRIDADDWFGGHTLDREAEAVRKYRKTTGGSAGGMAVDYPYHEPSGEGSMPQRRGFRKHTRR